MGLNEEQAYLAIQRQSRQKRKPMKEIAEAIVLSDEKSYRALMISPFEAARSLHAVVNLQQKQHHVYRRREIRIISAIGFLVGAEIRESCSATWDSTRSRPISPSSARAVRSASP